MTNYQEMREKNPFTCQLCGETDPTVDMWCGGSVGYAHKHCLEIGSKLVDKWLNHQLWVRNVRGMQWSEQKGWWCETCQEIYGFKTGKTCPKCSFPMEVAMVYRTDEEDS